jgi:hypothetical protein
VPADTFVGQPARQPCWGAVGAVCCELWAVIWESRRVWGLPSGRRLAAGSCHLGDMQPGSGSAGRLHLLQTCFLGAHRASTACCLNAYRSLSAVQPTCSHADQRGGMQQLPGYRGFTSCVKERRQSTVLRHGWGGVCVGTQCVCVGVIC